MDNGDDDVEISDTPSPGHPLWTLPKRHARTPLKDARGPSAVQEVLNV